MRRLAPLAPRRGVVVRLVLGIIVAIGLAVSTIQAQIPGRNVNMVSGNSWPDGDPFLQRQNEPSIAASTRNPLHLLAGSNDYRTVDVPGLPGDETGDAWLGLYKSFDGGQRWVSTLLPGYRQDTSDQGLASPIRGYGAGADPVVRAGTNGLIYYAGLVFDRSNTATPDVPGKSAIFVSRFIDNNNKEAGDPFAYLGTRTLQTDAGGATGNFLDKPWMVVDIPRDATRCTINTPGEKGPITQNLPAGPVYVAYTLRSTDSKGARYDVYFTRSVDCGNTWTMPVRLNSASERANQGATMAVDPRNGNVFIAWRQFDLTGDNDGVMSVKYTAAGKKLDPPGFAHKFPKSKGKGKGNGLNPEHFYQKGGVNKAIEAAQLSPLDQATSDIAGLLAFRTNAYPSLTVDGTGRVYMAWAERGYEPNASDPIIGDARIMVATSADGKTWTNAKAVAVEGQLGHQLMPTITFAGGKLMLVYYDLRETRSEVFSRWIDDATALAGSKQRRHTIDLRASMGAPGATPVFAPSVRVSDYLMGAEKDGTRRQLQVNPPNLPMFKKGTAPFMGDYVDVTAAPTFVVDAAGNWTYNSVATSTPPVFHATWTDNRDVRPPLEDRNGDGNPWNDYTPPGAQLGNTASILDPTQLVGQCIPGNAGSRNQNIYTARITGGLLVGSPGNTKTLSPDFQRAFVVFVQNTTAAIPNQPSTRTKTFRLTITSQPIGGRASFSQFPNVTAATPLLTEIDTVVPALSTASRTVYVTSTDPHARLSISVAEISAVGGSTVTGGLSGVIVLNPDIDNPDIDNPDIDNPDIDNPDIDNAEVYNPDIDNPDIDNPDIDNPDIDNPDIDNPDIDNVVIANPDIDNPDIDNPDIDNPDIDNPDIDNPDIDNPDIDNASLTDVSWTITNTGNTTAAYNVNLFFAQTTIKPELSTQLILYRTYRTPVVVNCVLKYETRNVLVANIPSPELVKSSTGSVSDPNDPDATNATIWLAPGESAKITLRVYDDDKSDNVTVTNPDGSEASIDPTMVPNEDVTPVVQQQGVDTEAAAAGETEPPIVVQFPAPQTVPDAASTAPNTPVTFNVLANDSTAFGSTKVISLHPPNMAAHSGGGPGDIAYQSSTGFLYTQRGIVDPATNALVGRLPLPPPGIFGIQYQQANQRTGINYGRTGQIGGGLSALDARPGSGTFHQYLPMPPIADTVFSFALDSVNQRMYVIHGPSTGTTTTLSVVDINPASPTFHTVRSAVAFPANTRGQSLAVNTRTQKVYVAATNSGGGVYVVDGTQNPIQAPVKVAGTSSAWSVVVNEAANMIAASAMHSGSLFALYVIDGVTNAMAQVNTAVPMRTGQGEERLALHIPTGRILMRLESTVVIIDTQRGSPTRNTVVGTVAVGREGGQTDLVIDQELGLAVTAGSFDFRADIIDIAAGGLAETIPLKAGSTDVAIDPVNHRAFVSVPLTYVQEISLNPIAATASVPVFIESGGAIVNPATNKAYAGILTVGGSIGVMSGAGFGGTINGLNTQARYLFSARYDAANRFFIVNQGNPAGTSYGPGSLVVINGADDTVEAVRATLPNPFGIAVNQATGKVYVASLSGANTPGGIEVFDATNIQALPVQATLASSFPLNGPTALVSFGRHVVVNPNTGKVYAMLMSGSPTSLVVLDPNTNVITPLDGLASPPPNGFPAGTALPAPGTGANGLWGRVDVIRVDASLNRIFVGMYDSVSNTNRIVAIDGTSDQVVGSWIGGRHSGRHTASYLVVNQGANRLYVTDYGDDDKVTMLDATTLAVLAQTQLPEGPSATAFNETANRLYVSSIESDSKMITALDGDTLAILSSVRLPLLAYFMAVDEAESRIYTSGGDSADESGVMVITDVLGQLGTNVSVSAIIQPSNGVAALNADYSITYRPNPGYSGPDQFGYTITAPTGSADGVVNVTVVSANPRSVAFADGYSTAMNQLLTVPAPGPLANDATGGAATMVIDTFPTNGALTPQADGSFTYQPNAAFVGADSFTYHTLGPLGASNTVPVSIVVTAATSLVVTNFNDSGAGSLRHAMSIANVEPGAAIAFAIPGAGPHVIAPLSPLPTMNVPVTIDGYTQNDPNVANSAAVPNTASVGTNAVLKIVISGPAGSTSPVGLNLRGGNSVVRGLAINGFSASSLNGQGQTVFNGTGIQLDNLGNNVIEGNFIGTNAAGTASMPNVTGVSSQSPNNIIGGNTPASRNLISGNRSQGARALASSNNGVVSSIGSGTRFKNNLIGTTATGMAALPNGGGGLTMSAPGVIIGGTSAEERNVISGNTGLGISAFANTTTVNGAVVVVSKPDGLTVQGNFIGTNALGTAALPNTSGGVSSSGAGTIIGGSNATPGGACSGACNVISGNTGTGVTLTNSYDGNLSSPTLGTIYSSAADSFVEGNYIGVNAAGSAAIGNTSQGMQLFAPRIRVGGSSPATRNVVSGNGLTTFTGGILVTGSTNSNAAANNGAGQWFVGPTASGALIRGNHIGVNAAGSAAIPNYNGISVTVPGVTVGGTNAADRNVVSGNVNTGINTFASSFTPNAGPTIAMTKPSGLIVEGNYVGTDATGANAIANVGSGIRVTGPNTRIGGTVGTSALSCTGACNLVSGNNSAGPTVFSSAINVQSDYNNTTGVVYSEAINSEVLGNYIGVTLNGMAALPNYYGLNVNAPNVTIGGVPAGARNVISGNLQSGISIGTTTTQGSNLFVNAGTDSKIWGNYVGVNAAGSGLLTNGQCGICSNAAGVKIGGPNTGEGNLVAAASSQSGIRLDRSFNSSNAVSNTAGTNTVQGNTIGLNATGTTRLNAPGGGISVASASNQIVGNVVAGHTGFGSGITLSGSAATGNFIKGNTVGTNLAGATGLGNGGTGITLRGSSNNTIGGLDLADRNVIVGNGGNGGVEFYAFSGDTMTGNQVLGNYIGVVPGGTAIPNNTGIRIYANPASGPSPAGIVSGTTIGGSALGARNIISGNAGDGINLGGVGTTNNSIVGNYIGTTIDGLLPLPNTGSGVALSEGQLNTVGGPGASDGNVIAFNGSRGVAVFSNSVRNSVLGNVIRQNGNLAIDLGNDGATANDANGTDVDTGANNLQNYPVLLNATTSGGSTAVDADLSSFNAGQYTVQFFASAACDTNGNSRAERFVGSFPASAGGTQTFQLSPPLAAGEYVTATATDAAGNTSELSPCFIQADVAPAVVTNTNNSGSGSLRNAMTYANTVPGAQTITFNIPNAGPHTIQPTSMLPILSGPVVIDGYSQPGASANTLAAGGTNAVLKIVINGANAAGAWAGLSVGSGGATIRGLVINGYTANGAQGILLDNPTGTSVVAGNFLGTDATGMVAVPNGWGVVTHSPNSVIGGSAAADRNLLSGNTQSGAQVSAATNNATVYYTASGSSVRNNLVGTNATGNAALPNAQSGIQVSVPNITIGGTNAADRNIVSGNGQSGISAYAWTFGAVTVTEPSGLRIEGNYIGTRADGMAAVPNGGGIAVNGASPIIGGTTGTTPGGACTGACNLISGNNFTGVQIQTQFDTNSGTVFSSASGATVQGNYVGVNLLGTSNLPNTGGGIVIAAASATVGGNTPAARNVVSGNNGAGITLSANYTASNTVVSTAAGSNVRGNYVGVTAAGTALATNGDCGICAVVASVTIGGPNAGDGNLVAGGLNSNGINMGRQMNGPVSINGGGNSTVQGNTIGLTSAGGRLDARGTGIYVISGNNQIRQNVVAGNGIVGQNTPGISLTGSFATGNFVRGNVVGTSAAGGPGLGNFGVGIHLNDAPANTIGGTTAADRNVIVDNSFGGLTINTSPTGTANNNVVQGNYIGLLADGVTARANSSGITVSPANGGTITGTTIGGSAAGAGNVVSGNTGNGIQIYGAVSNTTIAGNLVGIAANLSADRGNAFAGIWISDSANNTVGGANPGEGNIIAFNDQTGVGVQGNTALGNRISSNRVFSNGSTGIDLVNGGNNNQAAPALSNAANSGPTTTVDANLAALANGNYTVEFFQGSACGQGDTFVSLFTNVPQGPAAPFTLTQLVPDGRWLTATATDAAGNTSSFSACTQVTSNPLMVTNTNDSGAGSLRSAITYANATAGAQVITFNIPNVNFATINLTSALPPITEQVVIDGTTQPNYGNRPLIELNGAFAGIDDGLRIQASGVTVKALAIGRFPLAGISVTGNNFTLTSSYIGLRTDGIAAAQNGSDGVSIFGSNNTIGGTSANLRNVISANGRDGVYVQASNRSGNVILGNYIGVNATGTAAMGNVRNGVTLVQSNMVTVGGSAVGAMNVISGNGQHGVDVFICDVSFYTCNGHLIQGNRIGTDSGGTAAIANAQHGIRIEWAPNNIIKNNLISGNTLDGVNIWGTSAAHANQLVVGNLIGTTHTGNAALGNQGDGVQFIGILASRIGGPNVQDRNVIAWNLGVGAYLNGAHDTVVQGNYIGVPASGNGVAGNGATGVLLDSNAINVTVGGATPDLGNVISNNGNGGVVLWAAVHDNLIRNNIIGWDASGSIALGNTGNGIRLDANNNVIQENRIGNSTLNGVSVVNGTGNKLIANRITNNGTMGIDLGNNTQVGPDTNDPGDSDAGPNNLQNYPILTSVSSNGSDTTVVGTLNSTPNASFTMEFFLNTTADANGFGEGAQYLAMLPANTDGSGNFNFSASMANIVTAPGQWVSATATNNITGDTSEFSVSRQVVASNPLTVTNTNDSGAGSLRGAMTYSNTNPGHDVIMFAIPGASAGSPVTITLASPLPTITQPVTIDASLHPSWDGKAFIELSGNNMVGTGMATAPDVGQVTVRGLAFTRFVNFGLDLAQADTSPTGHLIDQNLIGTDRNGAAGKGNGTGMRFRTDHSGITNNVISGNANMGLLIQNDADDVIVQGNKIGTTPNGASPLGNNGSGIVMYDSLNDIVIQNNAIFGNLAWGIEILDSVPGDVTNTLIRGNTIGGAFGNNAGGISLRNAPGTNIGGVGAQQVITGNGGPGIWVATGAANIAATLIYNNLGLGIDKAAVGVTAGYPTLTSAVNSGASTGVAVDLSMLPVGNYQVAFYASVTCDPSNYGEGERLVGGANMAQPGGSANLSELVPVGQFITATVTGTNNDTSEFSACQVVTSPPAGSIMSLSPGSPAAGQMTTMIVSGVPVVDPLNRQRAFFSQGPNTSEGFVFYGNTTRWGVRLPFGGLSPGPASVVLTTPAGVPLTLPYNMTVGATPAAPVMTAISTVCTGGGFLASATSGDTIFVTADGIDTMGTVVVFTPTSPAGPAIEVAASSTCGTNSGTPYMSAQVTVPTFLNLSPTTVNVTIKVPGSPLSNAHSMTMSSGLSVVGPAGGLTGNAYGPLYCPAGTSAVGFTVDTDQNFGLTAADLRCSNGSVTTKFGLISVPDTAVSCNPGDVMVGIIGTVVGGPYLGSLAPRCQAPGGGAITEPVAPQPTGGPGSPFAAITCPAGKRVLGVRGGDGSVVDHIFLICGLP